MSIPLAARAPLVVATLALTGCTAGTIINPDGSTPADADMDVTFESRSGNKSTDYKVHTYVTSNGLTFAFDGTQPVSGTNGPGIPPGDYAVIVDRHHPPTKLVTGELYVNPHVRVSYDDYCYDSNVGRNEPCALFQLILCDAWAPGGSDIDKYGMAYCQQVTTSGAVTTVGLID